MHTYYFCIYLLSEENLIIINIYSRSICSIIYLLSVCLGLRSPLASRTPQSTFTTAAAAPSPAPRTPVLNLLHPRTPATGRSNPDQQRTSAVKLNTPLTSAAKLTEEQRRPGLTPGTQLLYSLALRFSWVWIQVSTNIYICMFYSMLCLSNLGIFKVPSVWGYNGGPASNPSCLWVQLFS